MILWHLSNGTYAGPHGYFRFQLRHIRREWNTGNSEHFTFFTQKSCVQLWAFLPKPKSLDVLDFIVSHSLISGCEAALPGVSETGPG